MQFYELRYAVEGLIGGGAICLGAIGFLFLQRATDVASEVSCEKSAVGGKMGRGAWKNRVMKDIVVGLVLVLAGYAATVHCFRFKVPGY
jgi:hypothetical protein